MSPTVLERLAALLIARFGVTRDEVRPDVTFAELDLDSLALVEFAMVAEKEFGIPLGDDEMSPQATVTDVVALIGGKVDNPVRASGARGRAGGPPEEPGYPGVNVTRDSEGDDPSPYVGCYRRVE